MVRWLTALSVVPCASKTHKAALGGDHFPTIYEFVEVYL